MNVLKLNHTREPKFVTPSSVMPADYVKLKYQFTTNILFYENSSAKISKAGRHYRDGVFAGGNTQFLFKRS
jgi:hypothetical protein